MSVEEDLDFRDLLVQALETNGCLAKIRAQLRTSVFLALDDDEEVNKKQPLLNKKIKTQLESVEGKIMFCIVREFLEFFDLDFTISVYEPESYLGYGYKYEGRCKIIQDLGIPNLDENSPVPLLLQLMQIAKSRNNIKTIDINLSHVQQNAETSELNTSMQNKSDSSRVSLETKDEINNSKESNSTATEEITSDISEEMTDSLNDMINQTNKNQNDLNATYNVNTLHSGQASSDSDAVTPEKNITENYDSPNSSSKKDYVSENTSSIEQSVVEADFSPPVLKESKFSKFDTSAEKIKKTDKLKAKNTLGSLSDLPPLNRSRNSDTVILPSLYSKEFKDKNSLKEIDKFLGMDLDSLDNYEEDFMSGGEIDLNVNKTDFLKSDCTKINLLDDFQYTKVTGNAKNINKIGLSTNKTNGIPKHVIFSENYVKSNVESKMNSEDQNNKNGNALQLNSTIEKSDTSITSEDFDVTSNDVLQSSDVVN